jgi:uncharacterized protein (TIGR03435 family)
MLKSRMLGKPLVRFREGQGGNLREAPCLLDTARDFAMCCIAGSHRRPLQLWFKAVSMEVQMKFRLFAVLAFLCGTCATVLGQDLSGTWQGALKTPARDLRIVFKISSAPENKFTGQMFSIDQGGQPIPISAISVEGRVVKIKIDALGATYDGTFAADGNSINGTFTQGPAPLPLHLDRATPQTAWAIPEPPPPPKPMDPAANPGIEVSTVKPSPTDARGRLYTMRGTQLMAINVSLVNLITFAYDLHERQVSGGPAWATSDKFEVVVKPDVPGQPNINQMKQLFRKVLAERFQLKFHTEKRELSVYAITSPANLKQKLTASAPGQNLPNLIFPRPGLLPARNATLTDLAQVLQTAVLDRPVVNQTGIEGRYDFTLDWMPDEFQFSSFGPLPQLPDTGKPNIFQAFQEQLGLKLESTRAPAEVMVVDKVEKASDN